MAGGRAALGNIYGRLDQLEDRLSGTQDQPRIGHRGFQIARPSIFNPGRHLNRTDLSSHTKIVESVMSAFCSSGKNL